MTRNLRSEKRKRVTSDEDEHSSDQEEQETYFVPNTQLLADLLTGQLAKKFPTVSRRELHKTLESTLKRAKAEIVEEYCQAVPKDATWKIGLESQEADRLDAVLKDLRKNIDETTPTMSKILKSNLPKVEKQRAVQMFDILNNTEPYTFDYVNLALHISEMIANPSKQHDQKTDNVLASIHAQMRQQMPNLEKIASACLTSPEKIRAIQLYEMWQVCPRNSKEWFKLQDQINAIVSLQMKSAQEVMDMEAQTAQYIPLKVPLKERILRLDCDPATKCKLYEMYSCMIGLCPDDSKYAELKQKIEFALELPHRKVITNLPDKSPQSVQNYCSNVYKLLNTEVFGMVQAKEKVIQCVNDRIFNPHARTMLALKGKPGVGKTKLAKVIAKASGLPFAKISLGGVIDSTIFKGSDPVWKHAGPSMLLRILSQVKYSNAVILLDEIDKLGDSVKGLEVQHALLHVLDPTQNKEFQDLFLHEFNHDISNIWFIPAMNDESKLDAALRDRLNIVEIPSYSRDDLVQIIMLHTLPETVQDKGLLPGAVTITVEACKSLLSKMDDQTKETGVRPVEKAISDIVSKLSLLQSLQTLETVPLSFKLPGFLGFPYVITKETIDCLVEFPKRETCDMYV